ncbi:MAG TPA: AMP-binding protein [Methyloceanibacter sp.]|nr:AMP-binding protein [Methyloceanibacter sp.]
MQEASDAKTREHAGRSLVAIASGLAHEMNPNRPRIAGLTSSLERDWGFDSLSRAELLLRIERAFSVRLPDRLLGEAETLEDLLPALADAPSLPAIEITGREPMDDAIVAPAPSDLTTLTEVLDWHVSEHGERVHAVLWHDIGVETKLTYRELAERARLAARGLVRAGLNPGERVAIMLPTGFEFFAAFFGVLYAGGVPVPIYPPARPSQLEEHLNRQAGILRNADASLLIAPPAASAIARLVKLQVESLRDVISPEVLNERGGNGSAGMPPAATALVQYTSGSTGDPKGVVLSHANVLANIRAMGGAMDASPSDVFVSWLPLYHDMGLIGAWLGSLYYAARLVVMSPLTFLVRPEQWLWAMHHHRATLSASPNFGYGLCLNKIGDDAIEGLDLGSLRMVFNGAEAVSPDIIRQFTARFAKYGFKPEALVPVYGLAENAVGLAFPARIRAPLIDRVDRAALSGRARAVPAAAGDTNALEIVACGSPLPGHEIRIVGATGELGEREEGRLQWRGPSATQGYFDNPAKTRELFDGDWLNSGDRAYIAGGDVYITGRSKDIIIRAGRNIYPAGIEEAAGDVPGIRKGCVVAFGSQDPARGTERVILLAETRETDAANLNALRERVEDTVTPMLDAAPDEIVLVPPNTIPKTSSGKLRRNAARELFEQGRLLDRPQPLWLQMMRFGASGVAQQMRRALRTAGEYLYAVWWWSVIVLCGAFLFVATLLIPSPARRWAVVRKTSQAALWLTGIRLEVTGAWPHEKNVVIVANHASYLDALVLAAVIPGEPAFIAKKELEAQVFAGTYLRQLGTLFVNRADAEGGVEDTNKALEAARAGRMLVFLPEGTFTRAPGLLPFRLGAFVIAAREKLKVLPVTLKGTRSILRGGHWLPRRGPVAIRVGSLVVPGGQDFAAAIRLRDEVRAEILANCGEPDAMAG